MAQTSIIDATSFNTTTGETSYTTGTIQRIDTGRSYEQIHAETEAMNAFMASEREARNQRWEMYRQTQELKKQTELLERIANQ